MKDDIYTLLNEMDNAPDSYQNAIPTNEEMKKWKKSFSKKTAISHKWGKYAAVAAVCICILGASLGPARQIVYAQVKAVTYDLAHLLGISKNLTPYQTVVGQSLSRDGITVTLNDVILDDETLLVSYTTTVPDSVSDPAVQSDYFTDASVYVNGKSIATACSGSVSAADEHNLISCLEIEVPGIDLSGSQDMEISFTTKNKKIGSLEFSASGEELSADTVVVNLNQSVTLPDGTALTFTKYTGSRVNQKIYFELPSGRCPYDIKLEGTDNLGNPVEFLIRYIDNGKGRMEVSTINNGYIHEDAQFLILTPYAVKMPETNGKMSNDFQAVGDAFTIELP